jgi:hypothetical protein
MNAITEKLNRSWQLFKRSVLVIREHPKLLVFPVVTGLLTTAIALFFLAPVALVLLAPNWSAGTGVQALADRIGFLHFQQGTTFNFQIQPLGTAILGGIYLANMFLATLASVAFNHQIMEALSGRPVSISRGLEAACARWKAVLLWSLLAGIVGLVIRAIEERLAFVGRLVTGFIGLAWSVAAIFAIPVLARDQTVLNPFAVLTKSATTIKRTWGEMLAGYVGMGGTNVLMLLFSIVFWVVTGLVAYVLSNPWLLLIAGLPWVLALIAYGYLSSIASRVYLCALYLYASEGFVPGHYDTAMMSLGWKMKKVAK